jgi:hypothetical protein
VEDSSSAMQASKEQIRRLREELSSAQKENTLLKETVQAKDAEMQIFVESKRVHKQIFSSVTNGWGPLDKEVRDRVQAIADLIRLNTNTSSNGDPEAGSSLYFPERQYLT